jgi:hypothetical protein
MSNVGRLLLRCLVIPLGYFAGVTAGTLVIVIGSWHLSPVAATFDPDAQMVAAVTFTVAVPVLLVTLLGAMWLPAAIGVLISEAFAIRSFIFHAGNGAAVAWIGWHLFGYVDDGHIALNQPLAIIAAGLAGGLAYWAIAGSSAGIRRPPAKALTLSPTIRRPQIR